MKRTVTEIFDHLSNEATGYLVQKYEIKENVDDMSKQRVYKNVMSNIDEGKTQRTSVKRGLRKTSVAAVAIVAALAVAGTSVAAGKLYKSYTDYKPAYTEEQKAAVEKATFAINESTGGEGVTITAVEGLCDGEKLFVITNTEIDPAKVKASEGYKDFSVSKELHISGDPSDYQGWSAIYHEVLETNGNTTTTLDVFDIADVKDGQTVGLSASVIARSDDDHEEVGSYGLTFKVQKSKFAKTFSADSGVKFLDTDATVRAGYVSPWYAQFWIDTELEGNVRDESNPDEAVNEALINEMMEKGKQVTFKVVLKDGTVYEGTGINADPQLNEIEKEESYSVATYFRCAFNEYVDTANIDHVEVNGVKINVK